MGCSWGIEGGMVGCVDSSSFINFWFFENYIMY